MDEVTRKIEWISSLGAWVEQKKAVCIDMPSFLSTELPFGNKQSHLCLLPDLHLDSDVIQLFKDRLAPDIMLKDVALCRYLQKKSCLPTWTSNTPGEFNTKSQYDGVCTRLGGKVAELFYGSLAPTSTLNLFLFGPHMAHELDDMESKGGLEVPAAVDVNVYVTATERARFLIEILTNVLNDFRENQLGKSVLKRRICRLCGISAEQLPQGQVIKACACRQEFYCSIKHQKQDWKRHKLICSAVRAKR